MFKVFAKNTAFQITISLQPNVIDLLYFKLLFVRSNNLSLKNQRFTPSDCRDLGF